MYSAFARFLAVTLLAATLQARPAMSLKWDELNGAIATKDVIVDSKDGSSVKGKVESVGPTALEVNVAKKGPVSISRDSIASLRLIKMGKKGRSWGLAGGVLFGLAGGAALSAAAGWGTPVRHPTYAYLGFAVLMGLPFAGYFIGKSFDRQKIRITILPD
jgi:hypothetical protein